MSPPVDLSERLASLTPAQRALFELALKKQEKAPPPPAPDLTIPKRRHQSPCALSVDQERVWFVQQLDPESPVFNVYNALRFSGRIQPAVLDRALNEVVRRQEILRVWFTVLDGTPMQVIEPALPVTLPCIDLRALPDAARDAEAQRIATDVVTPAIPMDRPPLFRIVLMQLADDDFVLPSCIHHIIIDWVSFYSFTTELTVIYQAFLEGRPSPLPELPVQYPDYAEWQRERLSDPAVTDGLVAWWKERLADAPELLPLPTDRPRPAVQTPWGRRSPLTLSAAHSAGLRELAQREGATLFTVLLAVLKATLSRLTGEEKLILGTPSGHRIQPELQEVLGFFLNQL
ncbi:MAG TPA: condensation domain-containing protein, partial [Thermoanaerobaculia bacterium]|nr:condensation domain-containing protein [Thermoanaerobaculia bacterium]